MKVGWIHNNALMSPAADIRFQIIYGIKVLPHNDPYIEIANRIGVLGSELGRPGVFLVDFLPFCHSNSLVLGVQSARSYPR